MTETQAPTLAITAEQFATLSPDAQTALDAQLGKAGFTAEQRAALKGTAATAPAANANSAAAALLSPVAQTPAPAKPTTLGADVSDGAKIGALKLALSKGVPPDVVAKAAAAEGVAWAAVSTEAAPVPVQVATLDDANQKLADTTGPLAAGTAPADYKFNFDAAHIEGLDPTQVRSLSDSFATALHAAQVPLAQGPSLVRELLNAAARFKDMPDGPERTLAFRAEGARLQRLSNVAEITADAEYAYGKMGAFRTVIDERLMMHTAEGYQAMARAGQAMRQRDAAKTKK